MSPLWIMAFWRRSVANRRFPLPTVTRSRMALRKVTRVHQPNGSMWLGRTVENPACCPQRARNCVVKLGNVRHCSMQARDVPLITCTTHSIRRPPMYCQHQPQCPQAEAVDHDAARIVSSHPEQGWNLLCNGVIVFE